MTQAHTGGAKLLKDLVNNSGCTDWRNRTLARFGTAGLRNVTSATSGRGGPLVVKFSEALARLPHSEISAHAMLEYGDLGLGATVIRMRKSWTWCCGEIVGMVQRCHGLDSKLKSETINSEPYIDKIFKGTF